MKGGTWQKLLWIWRSLLMIGLPTFPFRMHFGLMKFARLFKLRMLSLPKKNATVYEVFPVHLKVAEEQVKYRTRKK